MSKLYELICVLRLATENVIKGDVFFLNADVDYCKKSYLMVISEIEITVSLLSVLSDAIFHILAQPDRHHNSAVHW